MNRPLHESRQAAPRKPTDTAGPLRKPAAVRTHPTTRDRARRTAPHRARGISLVAAIVALLAAMAYVSSGTVDSARWTLGIATFAAAASIGFGIVALVLRSRSAGRRFQIGDLGGVTLVAAAAAILAAFSVR